MDHTVPGNRGWRTSSLCRKRISQNGRSAIAGFKSPVSSHFINNTGVDTEVPNMVTAVLADYRGFDTMFETVVVFIAGIAVLAILKGSGRRRGGNRKDHEVEAEPDLIVTNTVRLVVPIIQIFAFYVLAHGHVSPGGGFQGGVVMGASFILLALGMGLGLRLARVSPVQVHHYCPHWESLFTQELDFCPCCWVREFLDYAELEKVLPVSREMARYHAMLGVEIGVGFTVTCDHVCSIRKFIFGGSIKGGL